MRFQDVMRLAVSALLVYRLRTGLAALGIAVGVAAVVLLTSVGEGVHRLVLAEFTQFGTNLIAVVPGRTTTLGLSGAVISNVRPLSLADGEALRRIEDVIAVVPVVQGNAQVEAGKKTRRTSVFGVGPDVPAVWSMSVAAGRFLPSEERGPPRAYAVIGTRVRSELFRDRNPLGQRIRVGGDRYRVVGVMESKGQLLGFDLDDAVYIPAAKALEMFNRDSLMEIDLLYKSGVAVERILDRIREVLVARHGREDFTVVTQERMLDVLGSVLNVLTIAVGSLGGISLIVGAVGILTIMTIAVTERTGEIGLLRALGAERRQVLGIFLGEAAMLSGVGGLAGLVVGVGLGQILGFFLPHLPVHTSWPYALAAEAAALAVGLTAGVLPARYAANLEPLEALRAE